MPEAKVFTIEGKESGKVSLAPALFDVEINLNCIRESLNQYLANQRQGTACAKTRHYVSGGGKKPWRQKGTGRARAGSNRSPLWRGGAVTFGPLPRSYNAKINKKKRQKALCSALTNFAQEGRVFILQDTEFTRPKSQKVIALLKELGVEGKSLIIAEKPERNFYLSCRNLPFVTLLPTENICIYDLLDNDNLVVTQTALKKLEEIMG
jgi:large subunit ribosomal protein L4